MNVRLKNVLTRVITYLISGTGMFVILFYQYFSENNPMPTGAKIAVPVLISLLIFFLVYYTTLKEKINRKLIAIETAKELGKVGKTDSVTANLLETLGIVIPLILISAIFVIGGEYLSKTGIVLFEILGMYTVIVIGNIICDSNKKQELKEKELAEAEKMAEKIADKISNKYE